MSSNQTEHYGLNQWEGTDQFIRKEFNEDNAKLDAAIWAAGDTARRAMTNLAELSGSMWNLLLQNYYDGKETGWKRKLLFDGFLDETTLAQKDAALLWSPGYLSLYRTGQGNITIPSDESQRNDDRSTGSWTISAGGRFTGFTYGIRSTIYQDSTVDVTYAAYVNGVEIAKGKHTTGTLPPTSVTYCTLSFLTPYPVRQGDQIEIKLDGINANYKFISSSERRLSGTFRITSVQGTMGRAFTQMFSEPLSGSGAAWVRHMGGSVALSAHSGGKDYPLEVKGTRATRGLHGESCTETAFTLEGVPKLDSFALVLDLNLGNGAKCEVCDWGLAVL